MLPVSCSIARNVGNRFILKAVKTDEVCSQWAGLRDPSLRTAKNMDFEPADPSWDPACCTAETAGLSAERDPKSPLFLQLHDRCRPVHTAHNVSLAGLKRFVCLQQSQSAFGCLHQRSELKSYNSVNTDPKVMSLHYQRGFQGF